MPGALPSQQPQDPDLRDAAGMLQQALNAETVQEEERLWTEVTTGTQGPDQQTVAQRLRSADA